MAHAGGFLAVMLAAELGRLFWVGDTPAALVWPPAGLALGLALTFSWRILPTLAVGLLVWALAVRGLSPAFWAWTSLTLVVGAASGAWLARTLVRRYRIRGPVGELLCFWGAGLVAAAGISSFLGAAAVALSQTFPATGFGVIWGAYWASEAFGVVVFGPVVTRITWSLAQRGHAREPGLQPWHGVWTGGLATLVIAQLALGEWGPPGSGAVLVYFYFPLLAVCAGLGSIRFTDIMTVLICTGVVTLSLFGGGGMEQATSNFELLDSVLLVIAVTVTTQLVSAMAEVLKRQANDAREAARLDFLTELGNDRELAHRLAEWHGEGAAVALVDVSATRRALDLIGLERANDLERRVAADLRRRGSDATSLARIGRGLYALYWLTANEAEVGATLAGCYRSLNGVRHGAEELSLTLRPTVGAILLDDADRTGDDVMAMASQTLQQAQATSGERIVIRHADASLLDQARTDQMISERIRSALRRDDGFVLLAQPIVPLGPGSGRLPFYELLLRLTDPAGHLINPGDFLGVAARHGLMPEIDHWVMDEALRIAANDSIHLSVNVSGATLTDEQLVDWLDQRRARHGTPPERVCFEITETESIGGFDIAEANCRELRARGFRVALDDFGTGLASFEYVRRFPFDLIKIDGSFVRGASESATERAIVQAIQRVAATAGLATVAEFVEAETTREWLASIGVDYGQGFGIGRPVPIAEILAQTPGDEATHARSAATRRADGG